MPRRFQGVLYEVTSSIREISSPFVAFPNAHKGLQLVENAIHGHCLCNEKRTFKPILELGWAVGGGLVSPFAVNGSGFAVVGRLAFG